MSRIVGNPKQSFMYDRFLASHDNHPALPEIVGGPVRLDLLHESAQRVEKAWSAEALPFGVVCRQADDVSGCLPVAINRKKSSIIIKRNHHPVMF